MLLTSVVEVVDEELEGDLVEKAAGCGVPLLRGVQVSTPHATDEQPESLCATSTAHRREATASAS